MIKSYTLLPILLFPFLTISAINTDNYTVKDEVIIYPVPASTHFTVEIPESYVGGKIVITNMVGKEVMLIQIQNKFKLKVRHTKIKSKVIHSSSGI